MTQPNDPRDNITDSSAAATAMATGTKTYNDAIAVDNNHQRLKSVTEAAKRKEIRRHRRDFGLNRRHSAAFGVHNVSRKTTLKLLTNTMMNVLMDLIRLMFYLEAERNISFAMTEILLKNSEKTAIIM